MSDKLEKPNNLLKEWGIGFAIAYVALFLALLIAVGLKGNLFIAVFYLPVYWAVTTVMAVDAKMWSLLAINIIPFFILAMISRAVGFPLRYRVAAYLIVIGILGIYNFPKFIA